MEFTFTADKVNKGSVRFSADDSKSPVSSLYVDNEFLTSNGMENLPSAVADKKKVKAEFSVVSA